MITGGSSGIGRAAVPGFCTARRESDRHGASCQLRVAAADHANITGLIADVANPDDAGRTIETAVQRDTVVWTYW